MNTTTNLSSSGVTTEFIRYMKYAGAFVSPKDMTKYSYRPYVGDLISGYPRRWN